LILFLAADETHFKDIYSKIIPLVKDFTQTSFQSSKVCFLAVFLRVEISSLAFYIVFQAFFLV